MASQASAVTRLKGLPFKDNRERRQDAATESSTREGCLLSFWMDTLLAPQASSVTRLKGLPVLYLERTIAASARIHLKLKTRDEWYNIWDSKR